MRIEVLEEKDNPLLDRKEIVAKIIHDDSTPSRDDVRSKAIAKLKAKKDIFILDSIKTRFGARESIAHIRIYGSKDRVLEIESEHVLRKNSLISQEDEKKEGKVKEEKPAEEEKAKEPEKKESKKEEKPVKEEKPEKTGKKESKAEEGETPVKKEKSEELKKTEEATPNEEKTKEA
ncbi:MAG: hypothetical protein V3R82_07695 [Candidatus Hydrothermarchaeales archaeon]